MHVNIVLPRTGKSLEWPVSLRFVDQYLVDQYFVYEATVQMQALKNILFLLFYFT
jgi:hypothetical protein